MSLTTRIFRPTSGADLAGVADLLDAAFGPARGREAQLDWAYLRHPLGPAWVAEARLEDGTLAGHVAFQPAAPLAAPGLEAVPTFFSFNTAVRRDAPVPGLFPALTRRLFQTMVKDLGSLVVLGVANENSAEGFIRLCGFQDLGPLGLKLFAPWALPAPGAPRALAAPPDLVRWRLARPDADIRLHPGQGAPLRRIHHHGVPVDVVLSADPAGTGAPQTGRLLPAPRLYAASGPIQGGMEVPAWLRPSPLRQIVRATPDLAEPVARHLRATRFEFLDFDVV